MAAHDLPSDGNGPFNSDGCRVLQLNPWQPSDVTQTLIELERRLGTEWYLQFGESRNKRVDYVLVYKTDDDNVNRKEDRERFEQRLMADNLELVYIRSHGKPDEDESDEMYLLVHTPFYRLALECQSVKFDMPLKEQTNPRGKACCPWNCLETDDEVDFITAPFNLTRLSIYEGSDDLKEFFQPAIASFLTHHILINTDSRKEDNIQRGTTTKGLAHLLHTKAYEDAFVLHPYSPNDPLNTPFTKGSGYAHDICFQPEAVLSSSGGVYEGKPDVRQELADTWCQWFKFQPLWKIRNYFGEKFAFYFAWIGLLTSSLIVPSLLGSGVFVFGVTYSSSQNVTNIYDWMVGCFDNRATPVFSLIICVWGTLFLELWKRKHARLQYEWDVDHYDENEPDRPQFYGTAVVEDPVTKLEEVFYPLSRKLAKLAASLLIVFFMILLVLASLVAVIVYRLIFEHDWLSEGNIKSVPGDKFLPTLSASVLNGVSILILKQVYNRLAWKLTDWENHQTQSAYEDSLIVKLFAFHSVNSYASLFYIAFFRNAEYEEGFAGLGNKYRDSCGDSNDCMTMLTVQVAVLMFMQPLPKFIKDYIWPWVKKMWRSCRKKQTNKVDVEVPLECPEIMKNGVKVQDVTRLVEQQRDMQKMDNFHLTEYSEKSQSTPSSCVGGLRSLLNCLSFLVMMYGYLMIFAAAFPLAPLVAFLINVLDLRMDAKRLVWHTRRPVAEIAHNIGSWQHVMVFINVVAVISNSFLIAFTSDFGHEIREEYGDEGRLWLLVVFEHVVFIFMFLVSFFIPDVPQDIKNAKRRDKVIIDKIIQDSAVQSRQKVCSFNVKKQGVGQPFGSMSLRSVEDSDLY